MKELWKKQYKSILLVIGYIIVAATVYGVWVEALWNLWYVDLLVILAIIALGVTIGYFYIKSEVNKEKIDVEKKE